MINRYKKCSEQAQQILTTTHEREHIDQFARFRMNGENILNLTPEAEQLYRQMASEIGPMSTQEAEIYRQMARYNPVHKTMVSYIADPSEIAARQKEIDLLSKLKFQTLDKVFKRTNKIKVNPNKTIVLNSVRAESATN